MFLTNFKPLTLAALTQCQSTVYPYLQLWTGPMAFTVHCTLWIHSSMQSFLNTIKVPWNHIFVRKYSGCLRLQRVSETQEFSPPCACMSYDLSLILEKRDYLSSDSLFARLSHIQFRRFELALQPDFQLQAKGWEEEESCCSLISNSCRVVSGRTERPDLNTDP